MKEFFGTLAASLPLAYRFPIPVSPFPLTFLLIFAVQKALLNSELHVLGV